MLVAMQELLEFSLAHQSQLAGDGELFGYDDDGNCGEGYGDEEGEDCEGGLAPPQGHFAAAAADEGSDDMAAAVTTG